MNEFEQKIKEVTGKNLRCDSLKTVQVNIGFRCNQECRHCHVQGSPSRVEMMEWSTMQAILEVTKQLPKCFIDITGGAPELHPCLTQFIQVLHKQGHQIQVRTNLTLLKNPEMKSLINFLKTNKIQLVASLPCYLEEEVRLQRGKEVFEKSIKSLQMLNTIGYGVDSSLSLILVFNSLNPVLPPEQLVLEKEYHQVLGEEYGINFTRLITITNMPIGRFLQDLQQNNQEKQYRDLLKSSFNPETIEGLMCRHQINIGWDGTLYDCDFNLAQGLHVASKVPQHIKDFNQAKLSTRPIVTGTHCFGCAAGHGSSCGGALV
ncbi:MAG: arsenosugar biosynthesis radical SAM protein ArsS [Euryarchaeota archaeon]|nr:arsenosugar biosynthesis radical SAM protein ArsS [Euryarchaeota archaeon]